MGIGAGRRDHGLAGVADPEAGTDLEAGTRTVTGTRAVTGARAVAGARTPRRRAGAR
ncbi:hypothetical protein ACIG47_23245 [Promicromonospora sp. NPDC052451]|uniref:hypothetical protein n=1 Tax=Promicromonospora sp. NPDC052451 TaxID=3364407 RepID=UPI0037CCBA55